MALPAKVRRSFNKDATVSRKSVADLIVKVATTPGLEARQSLGVHKAPGTPF